jgi:Putative prokaryotic signal transducing protein
MPDHDLVVLRTFNNHIDADVAKSALDAADIDSVLSADDMGGVQPGLWASEGVALLVRSEDALRAAEILDTPPTASASDT